jgi:hypothetical protein
MTLLFCAPFLFSKSVPRNYGDVYDYAGPFRHYAARRLQAGQWPLWNPHIFAGAPFLASPQSGLFYPPNQLFWFFPLARAVNAFTALHLFLNAAGMALFLAAAGRRRAAPWLGGAAWGFGLFFLGKIAAGHVIHLSGYAWIGFILAALLPRGGSAPLLAAAGALQFFSGHIQVAEHTALAAVLLSAGAPGARGMRLRRGAAAAAIAAVGVAAQAWPTAAYLSLTTRAAGFLDAASRGALAVSYSLSPRALAALVGPGLFGHPFRGTFSAGAPSVFFESYCLSVGWIPLAAGIVGLIGALRKRRWGIPLAGAMFLLLALGGNGPLEPLFRGPLANQRAPARFISWVLWILVWAGASAVSRARRGLPAALTLAVVGQLWFQGRGFLRAENPEPYWAPGAALRALDWSGPFPPRLALSGDVPLQNKGMLAGFENVNGFEALVPANLAAFAAFAQPGAPFSTTGIGVNDPSREVFRPLACRYALLPGPAPGWRVLARVGPGTLSEDPAPLPPLRAGEGEARLVEAVRLSPEKLDSGWAASGPFTALWSERYDPGWMAWSGGRRIPVREVLGALLSAQVRTEKSTAWVQWRYRPWEARAGLWVSAAAWLAAWGGAILCLKKLI